MTSKVNPGIDKLQDDGASLVQPEQSEVTNLNPQKSPDDQQKPRYMRTKYELENQDLVQKAVHYVKVVLKMLPSVLGLLDEITDYTYYATQPFAHESLKNAFLFYILFTPFLQTVIWDAYFAVMAHKRRDKTAYENIRRQYFQVELEKKRLQETKQKGGLMLTIKSSWLLFLMYIRESVTFFYYMLYYSLLSLIYAIMQEIKFLPFFITFCDPVLKEIKYPITKELIEEFKSKELVLKAIEEIDEQNIAIDKINRDIELYNALKGSSMPSKPLRAKVKRPTVHSTDSLKTADILSMEKSVSNQLLHDPYVESFLLVGEMVEAVFESLPMLTIQYINNSMLNLWGGIFNIFSFIFSVLMISIQCAKMVYAISESQTFPLLRFKDYAKKTSSAKERYQDPIWILQNNPDQVYQIHDIDSLEKAAHANATFYKTVSSILFDVSGDESLIKNCLQGSQYPFQCISNVMKSMNSQNELILQFSNNEQVTAEYLKIIFNSLAGSQLQKLILNSSFNYIKDLEFTSGLIFSKSLQYLDLDLSHSGLVDIKGLCSIQRLNILEVFKLNLRGNSIENCDAMDNLRYLQNLKQLYLDLESNQLEVADPLTSISCLNELTDLEILVCSNRLNDVGFLKFFSPLVNLISFRITSSNLEVLTTEDYEGLSNCTNMKKLDIFLNGQKGIDLTGFSRLLPQFTHLEELYFDLGYTELKDTSVFDALKYMKNIRKLVINYKNNSVYNFNEFSHIRGLQNLSHLDLNFYYNYLDDIVGLNCLQFLFKIKFLSLNLRQNGITDISFLNLDTLVEIETLRLDISNNKIENFTILEKIFGLITLRELDLKVGKADQNNFQIYSKVSQLRSLQTLCLDFWQQQDLSEISFVNQLEDLTSLRSLKLFFGCNNIMDASPLCIVGKLLNLEELEIDLSACRLSEVNFLNQFHQLIKLRSFYLCLMQNYISTLNLEFLRMNNILEVFNLNLGYMKVDQQDTILQGILENKPFLKDINLTLSDNPISSLDFLKFVRNQERLINFSLEATVGRDKIRAIQASDIFPYISL